MMIHLVYDVMIHPISEATGMAEPTQTSTICAQTKRGTRGITGTAKLGLMPDRVFRWSVQLQQQVTTRFTSGKMRAREEDNAMEVKHSITLPCIIISGSNTSNRCFSASETSVGILLSVLLTAIAVGAAFRYSEYIERIFRRRRRMNNTLGGVRCQELTVTT